MSKGFKASLLVIILVVLTLLFWPMLSMMFPCMNCTKDQINIKTGQGRHLRYIAFFRVSETIYDTPLSEAIKEPVEETTIKAWHSVNTFAPPWDHYSPHHIFHGALGQSQNVGLLFESRNMPSDKKTQIAVEILKAWQRTGNDSGASEILDKLWEEEMAISNNQIEGISK